MINRTWESKYNLRNFMKKLLNKDIIEKIMLKYYIQSWNWLINIMNIMIYTYLWILFIKIRKLIWFHYKINDRMENDTFDMEDCNTRWTSSSIYYV